MFHLRHVSKRYSRRGQEVAALEDVSITIESGEYVALLGASGSGKTTLLSILGGMLGPTDGVIQLDGQSIYEMTLRQRAQLRLMRFGFVFQTFNLIPYLTALENVQVPIMLAGGELTVQQVKAQQLLSRFGLADRLHHRPSELSVGQQQRVALARTLANDPEVILADEPTGNLDPLTRDSVLESLDEFHCEGRTVVVVTHDPTVASRAQRQITLLAGRLSDDHAHQLAAA